MKRILSIIIIVAVAAGAIYVLNQKLGSRQQHSGMTGQKEIWYCPMHPHYTSDKPGTCPICFMKLVKKEGHPDESHALHEHQGHVNATTPEGYATVQLNPQQQQLIGVKTDTVKVMTLTRTIHLHGTIDYLNSRVTAHVYESDLAGMTIGQKAYVDVPAYGDAYQAEVRYIDRIIDPQMHTVQIRLSLLNAREILKVKGIPKVDVSALVHLVFEQPKALALSKEAVMDTGTRKIVFVQTTPGVIEPREVRTGLKGDDYIQILTGLKEGETVVVSGNFLVDSESRLQAAISGMEGAGHVH